ncbi:12569_t:CDS:2, partial [Gigaspora rosea]
MSYNVGDNIKLSEAFQFHHECKYSNAWESFSELEEKSNHVAYEAKFMMVKLPSSGTTTTPMVPFGCKITVYDIPGSLIGRRRLFRQNVYVPSKTQLKYHAVDYLESLVGIKKLLKNLKSQLRDTEDILNKLVKQGDNNNKLQIDIRNRTIVRNNRNSSGA